MDPVIVVGAGPVGLCTALALTRRGVPVVVLDEGPGREELRPARTAILRADIASFLGRLGCAPAEAEGVRWTALSTLRRRQVVRRVEFGHGGSRIGQVADPGAAEENPPLHLPQHVLVRRLRAALAREQLAQLAPYSKLDAIEQDERGVTVHTRGAGPEDSAGTGGAPRGGTGGEARAWTGGGARDGADPASSGGTWWRGSHLVGCDGPRSTVRKLLSVRFPGRTAVERHAVAALRAELPWPGEAVLHRSPPGGVDVTARPLPDGLWRVDWLLPPRGELVTPEALVARIRDTLAVWCGGTTPPYELLDTGVHTVHHRLALRWRVGRAFLAGDAAHLVGALGTQAVDEGLRDAENLAWKLALVWHRHAPGTLLDSYEAERRTAVGARLRAADQALPLVRGTGSWPAVRRSLVPGAARGDDAMLTDGHLGCGPLGAPPVYERSPLTPSALPGSVRVGTAPGAPVADVPVTAPDGSAGGLRDRLGRDLLVVLVAPGTAVWDRRHWMSAGLMPRLASAVAALPIRAELLVTEGYPGAAAHTVLVVRPDGHLVAALSGVRPAELHACADTARGGAVGGRTGGGGAAGADGAHGSDTEASDAEASDVKASGADGALTSETEVSEGGASEADAPGAADRSTVAPPRGPVVHSPT
ncbi:FAD-dependent monooxygenase [Streptomyces pathocidini]|uniref:FAD-dependent monooxygenase n=2 Tax=Streptomyces pathocidini TaxID=1650571 RepID=A0ABW7UIS7_9ACTN